MASYSSVFSVRRLWMVLAGSMFVMFGTLLYFGSQIYQAAPPIPAAFRTGSGQVVFTREQILAGQNVWQSIGGMQQGSIWGHGSYVAPDWSADWLHREAVFILDRWAGDASGRSYDALTGEQQAALRERLTQMMRRNTYEPESGRLVIDPARAEAFEANLAHFSSVFRDGR